MIDSALRRIGVGALVLQVALTGYAVSSLTPPASHPSAAASVRGPSTELRERDPDPPPVVVWAPPVRLLIPSLNLDARVEALGVDSSGAMDTPHNIWNVGWYRDGPSPGAPGDAVIDGHVGLPGSPLVFANLAKVAIGADVIAVLADGTRSRFSVTDRQSWPANSHPNGLFSGEGEPRLSLITCTGAYDRRSQNYADRLIVEASYVGPA